MKLKSYILVGYIISTLLTIIVVFWAIQRMLIEESEIYQKRIARIDSEEFLLMNDIQTIRNWLKG